MPDRYLVIGNPIAHSKSPHIHRLFAQQTGQDIDYDRLLAPLDGFAATVQGFIASGGKGANITVPFKQEAFALATRLSERARTAKAVNTLAFSEGEIFGDNTDGAGLVNDLIRNHGCELSGKSILVVGAGGAVRGILQPLLEKKPAKIVIANRTISKAQELAQAFHSSETPVTAHEFADLNQSFDLIINGSASSLAGELPPVPKQAFAPDSVVYDMMYGKEPTVFLQHARSLGVGNVIDGLGMLVEQAAEAFTLWRGVRPETKSVLDQLRSEL